MELLEFIIIAASTAGRTWILDFVFGKISSYHLLLVSILLQIQAHQHKPQYDTSNMVSVISAGSYCAEVRLMSRRSVSDLMAEDTCSQRCLLNHKCMVAMVIYNTGYQGLEPLVVEQPYIFLFHIYAFKYE